MPISGSMACEGSYPHQNSYTESKNKRYLCAVERDGESTSTSDFNGTDSTIAEIVYENRHTYICMVFYI